MNGDIAATTSVISVNLWLIVMVFAASFAGVVIQSVAGFGYPIVLMTILPLIIPDLSIAVAAANVSTIFAGSMQVWRHRRSAQWKLLPPLLGCYFVTSYFAILFAATHPVGVLRRPMGAFLIFLAAYFIFFASKIKIKGSPIAGCVAGCISGVTGGLFAIPAPPMAVYVLSVTSSNAAYAGTIQAFLLSANIYTTIMRFINGLITHSVLMVVIPAIMGIVIGIKLGTKLFDKLDPVRLRRVVYVFMAASGLLILITG